MQKRSGLYRKQASHKAKGSHNEDSTLEKELTVQRVLAYFEGGNIATGAVSVTTHDNAYIAGSLGFKTLQKVEKYQVDVLGNYTRVKKEKRQLFPAQRR